MSILILALIVLGGTGYILVTLFSYFHDSSDLSQELEESRIRVDSKKQRLREYETHVSALQQSLPARRGRCDHLERWISLLKQQRAKVEAETSSDEVQGGDRRQAVRDGFLEARNRKKGL